MEKFSRKEAEEKIKEFFQKDNFKPEEVKKIKRLTMKFNIKLGEHRKKFCKKCLSQLAGKTRAGKDWKKVVCKNCGFENKFRLL